MVASPSESSPLTNRPSTMCRNTTDVLPQSMTLLHVHGMVVDHIPFLCEVRMEGKQRSTIALYHYRKRHKLCASCRDPNAKAIPGTGKCASCLEKSEPPRIDPVTCYRCFKPTAPRSKLCPDCIDELLPK